MGGAVGGEIVEKEPGRSGPRAARGPETALASIEFDT